MGEKAGQVSSLKVWIITDGIEFDLFHSLASQYILKILWVKKMYDPLVLLLHSFSQQILACQGEKAIR